MCLVYFVQFWCIGDRLVDLRNSVQNGPNWCKSSCHEVASEFFATNAPDPPHWTLKKCFGAFHKILVHLEPFGWLTKLDENRPKWCKSSCHEALSEFFATNAPVPPHWTLNSCVWCISYNFGALGTVWLTYETRCKTGRTGAKVRATKSRRNFSQPMHPIHRIGP